MQAMDESLREPMENFEPKMSRPFGQVGQNLKGFCTQTNNFSNALRIQIIENVVGAAGLEPATLSLEG